MTIPIFPTLPGNTWPVKRAPQWAGTARHVALSQRRTFTPGQAFPRWQWQIPIEMLRSAFYSDGQGTVFAELETLAGFFNLRSAGGAVFAYADAEDYAATNAPFGTGDGATQAFQLYRAYGGFTEPVYAPDVAGLVIKVAGTPTVAYTLGATGVVTFDSAPAAAAALTWTGTFKWLCRFDSDSLDLQRFMLGLSNVGGQGISFSAELNP